MVDQCARIYKKKPVDVVSVFEAVGAYSNKEISKDELYKIEEAAIPGPGSCGGMYTANTMASAIEALGMVQAVQLKLLFRSIKKLIV